MHSLTAYHKGVAVTVGVRPRQIQTARVHGAQLPETLAAEQTDIGRRVLATLQQHRHEAGDDGLHRLAGTHLSEQPLLQNQRSPVVSQAPASSPVSVYVCIWLLAGCASCPWGWWERGSWRPRSHAERPSWRVAALQPGHCCWPSAARSKRRPSLLYRIARWESHLEC